LKEEDLRKIFTDKGYNVKKVLLNTGFGFIEFDNEAEQTRVLQEIPTVNILGRTCCISAARTRAENSNIGFSEQVNEDD
jgi:RNA recognition motif-containing protein